MMPRGSVNNREDQLPRDILIVFYGFFRIYLAKHHKKFANLISRFLYAEHIIICQEAW